MRLRTKIVLFSAVMYIPLCLLFYAGLHVLLMRNFQRLEENSARDNMNRVVNALQNDLLRMDATLQDWSSWSDMYQFLEDTNEDFRVNNLFPEALKAIQMNIFCILRPADHLFFSMAFDLNESVPADLSPAVVAHMEKNYGYLTPVSIHSSIRTFLALTNEPPMLFVSRHILDSRHEGPSRGFLVMGRYITDSYISNLCAVTENNVVLFQPSGAMSDRDRAVYEKLRSEKPNGAFEILPENAQIIASYTIITDAAGAPAFMLRVDHARTIYQNGLMELRYMLFYVLGMGLLSGLLLMILLERLLVSRLVEVSGQLTAIADDPDHQALPAMDGRDELSGVVQHINNLLDKLSARRLALQESEERYRSFAEHFQGIAFRCDLPFKPVFYHGAVESITGYSESDLLAGKPALIDLVHPDDLGMVSKCMQSCGQELHYTCECEFRIRHRDGSLRWVRALVRNLSDPNETKIRCIQGAIYDVTITKKAEEDLRMAKRQMDHLARHLQDVREIEKTRLARQLHDELGQLLMALKIDMKWLAKKVDPAHVPSNHITSMLNMLGEVEACVKHIATELKPGVLEKLDLQDALEWLIHSFSKEHTIPCDFKIDMGGEKPDKRTSTIVFRIIQEGLINIFRHSQATKVQFVVTAADGEFSALLRDNGVGVPQDILNSFTSFGFIQMRERADSLGGNITFSSPAEGGFVVQLNVPMHQKREPLAGEIQADPGGEYV